MRFFGAGQGKATPNEWVAYRGLVSSLWPSNKVRDPWRPDGIGLPRDSRCSYVPQVTVRPVHEGASRRMLEATRTSIQLYVNTPGGSATAGLAIYDTMQYMRSPVSTICVGLAASAGAIILGGGTKGRRFALPYSRMMIHQPWGGAQGTVTDIGIQTKEFMAIRQILNEVLAKHTAQPMERVERDTERNFWMSSQEAKEYGLIDDVIKPRQLIAPPGR